MDETNSDRGSPSNNPGSVDLKRQSWDAVIIVDKESFPINKVHLSTCSPYFEALLLSWSTPDTTLFEIHDLSADIMRLIFDFAYSGLVSVTEDNVKELFRAADYLLVYDIVKPCSDFLEGQLGPENCIDIWKLTDISLSPELRWRAYQCITDNFEMVVSSEDFQQLSVQDLTDLLIRDDLNIRESRLFEAILQWITHAPEERKGHLNALLPKVRLGLIGDIMSVMSNELIRGNNESLQIIRDAQRFIRQMELHRPPLTVSCNPIARPRLPNVLLLAIGGRWFGDINKRIDAYDVRADRWVKLTVPQWPCRIFHGTAVIGDYIYCVGGINEGEDSKSVVKFDMKTHTWHKAAPMHEGRLHVSVTVLNGCIYAMGGLGESHHRTAERFNPETNQWTLIAPMNEKRWKSSSTTLNSKIYICGGWNGHMTLNSCEYYSPETNHWTIFSSMGSRRVAHGVIAYTDQIFAVGGRDGQSFLCTSEAYNPRTNTWHEVSSMFTKRCFFGTGVIDNKLFVVGGHTDAASTESTEFYDASTGQWVHACDVEFHCSGVSCCVVPRLPNMVMCTIPRDDLPCLHLE